MVLLHEVCQRRPVERGKIDRCCWLYETQNIRAISNRHENTHKMESSTAVKIVRYDTFEQNNRAISHRHENTPTNYTTRSTPLCTPTTHPPPTDQPTTTVVQQQWSSTYRPSHKGSTAVQQYAPQRYTFGMPGAGWDLHFLTILHVPGESANRHPPSTHYPGPPTDQPTTTAVQQQRSSTYRPIHNGSTAVRQLAPQRYTCGTAGARVGFALPSDSPPSGGEREPSPTKHPPPTTHPPTNPPPQHYNSSGAVLTDQSTTAAQQYGSSHHSDTPVGTPGAGWDLHFLTILYLPGESASRPRESFFIPPARGSGTRQPLCCRGHRWLMCGAGLARTCGR